MQLYGFLPKAFALGFWLVFTGSMSTAARGAELEGAFPNDGIDDTDAFIRLFQQGGAIKIPEGVWDFSSSINVSVRQSLDVTATNAVFKSNGIDGDLLRFFVTATAPDDLAIDWQGGTLDITEQKNSQVIPYVQQGAPVKEFGERNTADALSIRGTHDDRQTRQSTIKITRVSISDLDVIASKPGENWKTAGGDSGIFIIAGSAIIRDSYFRGLRDDAIYLSADGNLNEIGGNYVVDNVVIENSVKGIAVQRGADNVVIKNSQFHRNEIGIVIDGTDDNSPKDVVSRNITIENNEIMGSWLAVRLSDVENVLITGNKIDDLVPFEYLPHIPPKDLYLWDDTQVSGVRYENNLKADGTAYPDTFIGAGGH